ncbi:MAG: S26 family signal peptidase [Acholeplasmataceae bacterium]|nr:S26 family signal peptidase [Acholeplasmataceae bacterium]
MKKIVTGTFTTIAILIFMASIVLMITGTIALRRNQPVYIFGKALAVVPTDSMVGSAEDSLDINDMVLIRKASIDEVELNDVIVFQGTNNSGAPILVIHRVIGFAPEGLVTKGDNNTSQDQPQYQEYVTEDNFEGIYTSKITFLKPIAGLMTSSKGLIFGGLAVVLTIMLISEVIHLVNTYQEDKKELLKAAHEKELEDLKEAKKKELRDEILKEEKIT